MFQLKLQEFEFIRNDTENVFFVLSVVLLIFIPVKDKTIIYFVVNRFQISKLRAIVSHIDKKAYVTISDVADVFKGFE